MRPAGDRLDCAGRLERRGIRGELARAPQRLYLRGGHGLPAAASGRKLRLADRAESTGKRPDPAPLGMAFGDGTLSRAMGVARAVGNRADGTSVRIVRLEPAERLGPGGGPGSAAGTG